jgi:hypothetical protein
VDVHPSRLKSINKELSALHDAIVYEVLLQGTRYSLVYQLVWPHQPSEVFARVTLTLANPTDLPHLPPGTPTIHTQVVHLRLIDALEIQVEDGRVLTLPFLQIDLSVG